MHVHVGYDPCMRTTVEIPDEQRAELLRLAAARGEKGFSSLVRDALDLYLKGERARRERARRALRLRGSMGEAAARRLEESIRSLRGRWR